MIVVMRRTSGRVETCLTATVTATAWTDQSGMRLNEDVMMSRRRRRREKMMMVVTNAVASAVWLMRGMMLLKILIVVVKRTESHYILRFGVDAIGAQCTLTIAGRVMNRRIVGQVGHRSGRRFGRVQQ